MSAVSSVKLADAGGAYIEVHGTLMYTISPDSRPQFSLPECGGMVVADGEYRY